MQREGKARAPPVAGSCGSPSKFKLATSWRSTPSPRASTPQSTASRKLASRGGNDEDAAGDCSAMSLRKASNSARTTDRTSYSSMNHRFGLQNMPGCISMRASSGFNVWFPSLEDHKMSIVKLSSEIVIYVGVLIIIPVTILWWSNASYQLEVCLKCSAAYLHCLRLECLLNNPKTLRYCLPISTKWKYDVDNICLPQWLLSCTRQTPTPNGLTPNCLFREYSRRSTGKLF
eukprot:5259585-Amphidinium_carterae.1